jgi:hypothetical protein
MGIWKATVHMDVDHHCTTHTIYMIAQFASNGNADNAGVEGDHLNIIVQLTQYTGFPKMGLWKMQSWKATMQMDV